MKNRRTRPDAVMNLISGISIISWIALCSVCIIFSLIYPRSSIIPAGHTGIKNSDVFTDNAIFELLILMIILSVSGILFNTLRLKRRNDGIMLMPVFSGIFAVAGLIFINIKL